MKNEIKDAVIQVQLESTHYLNTERGVEFLRVALVKALNAINANSTRYCDDSDYCAYSDCPTAFCDAGVSHSRATTLKDFKHVTIACFLKDTK